jgi:hypothetical protein
LHCRPHYRAFAGLELDPTDLGGIFDTENVENPLADYTLLYLPTANGDLFLGDAEPVYDTPGCCQSNRNWSPVRRTLPLPRFSLGHKGFPLSQCSGASGFVNVAADEVTLLTKMVVQTGMD